MAGADPRKENLIPVLEVHARAPQASAPSWGLAAVAGCWCLLCSRETQRFLKGGCPSHWLGARQGPWLSWRLARHQASCVGLGAACRRCVTGCLSQVSLAPQDTSPPRCSGRIPTAKPWTCGLAVSQTGAEMLGVGWAGLHGMRQAVDPAHPKPQSLDTSWGGQGGGFIQEVAHYPGLSPKQDPPSQSSAPSSEGSAPLLRTQSPQAGEVLALLPWMLVESGNASAQGSLLPPTMGRRRRPALMGHLA